MSIRIIVDAGDPIQSYYAANIEALHDQVQAEMAAQYLNQPTALNLDMTPVTPHDEAWGCGDVACDVTHINGVPIGRCVF